MNDFKVVISLCLSFPFIYYKTKKVLGKSKLFSISSNMICSGDELIFQTFWKRKDKIPVGWLRDLRRSSGIW